jgi:hypothetical protein
LFLYHTKAVVNLCVPCTMQRQLPVSVIHSFSESLWQSNYVSGVSGIKRSKVLGLN